MAKVISWSIEDKLAYLGGKINGVMTGPQIRPASDPLTGTDLSDLASYWVSNNDQNAYMTAFSAMLDLVGRQVGPTNLKPWTFYYNVLNETPGAIMIAGKDGKNTYDTGTPYYTLHILNQNIAIGLGGNYILDADRSVTVDLYVERDGVNKTANITKIEYKDTASSGSYTEPSYDERMVGDQRVKRFEVLLPNGSDFTNGTHIKSFEIKVSIGDYISTTYFTVTGLKNGEEGSFYNLTISPKTIKRVKEGDTISYSSSLVNAYCVKNGTVITADNIKIMYNNGKMQNDAPFPTGGIAAEDVYNAKDNTILVKLLYNDNVIDTDSCTVLEDGADASPLTKLELYNEMDGISFGESNVLLNDIFTGSGVKMWYEGSELPIKAIKFKIVAGPDEINFMACRINGTGNFEPFSENGEYIRTFVGSYPTNVSFDLQFKEGFTINDNYREAIKISATASTNNLTASTNYVLIGIKGGKNGEIYRIQTDYDYVIYDPNTNVPSTTTVSCVAYAGNNDITEDPQYALGCSYDVVYKTWEEITEAITIHGTDAKYIDETNYFSAITNGNSSVTFYLFYKSDNEKRYLLDRETIPIIYQGMDAHERVMLELENEITGVALGGDGKLDTQTDVGTTFTLYSGDSPCQYSKIMVEAPSELNGYTCKLQYGSLPKTKQFANGKVTFDDVPGNNGTGEIIVTLTSPTYFNTNNQKKLITITVYDENGTGYRSVYSILGINNGEDGVVYRLQPSVNSIVKDENKEGDERYNPRRITCDAYEGTQHITDVSSSSRSYKITYNIDNDVPENSTDTRGDGIPVDDRINDRVYYYLYYRTDTSIENWVLVDKESIPIICDGKDGKDGKDASERTELELANEIEGIGIGNNKTLDIQLTVGTDFYVFSGTTKIGFKKIEVQTSVDYGFLTGSTGTVLRLYKDGTEQASDDFNANGLASITVDIVGYEKARIEIDLKPVLGFDESTQKRIFHISATTLDNIVYSADFTVIGLINGKDGDVFKVVPSEDVVTYDPNSKEYSVTGITCQAYNGGTELTGGEYEIKYSYNTSVDYDLSSAYTDNEAICVTGNGVSRVYLYLYYVTGSTTPVLLDRETVPIIYDGLDGGTPVYLEFGNEIEAIGVDEDGVLNSNITAATDFYVFSGAAKIAFNKLVITTPEIGIVTGTTGCQCKIELNGYTGTTGFTVSDNKATATFTGISAASYDEQFLSIGIVPDLYFNEKQQRVFTVTATYIDNENQEQPTKSNFTILGLKNGEDGSIFRVKPSVNTIVFDSNKEGDDRYSPSAITCEAYNGVVKINDLAQSIALTGYVITYSIDQDTDDITDTTVYTNSAITVTGVTNRIYLYLWYRTDTGATWELFDKESVPIVKDGIDGKGANDVVLFEVFNEIDAIGVGSNLTVDVPLTASTNFCLYSGATPLVFNRLKIQANKNKFSGASIELVYDRDNYWPGSFNQSGVADINLGSSQTSTLPEGYKKLDMFIEIPTGLTFADGQKEDFYLSAYTSSSAYYIARFSVLGLANGEDGDVFKITPTVNSIVKDPNDSIYEPTGITCGAYNGITDLTPYAGMSTTYSSITDSEYVGYRVKCSVDTPITNPSATGSILYTGKIVESSDINSRIYFYLVWREKTGDTWTLLDKESVPIIKSGLDGRGSADKFTMDLTNKTDSWGVGDNGILDITISASTGIETYSGGTLTGVSQVKVEIDNVYFDDTQKYLSNCTDNCAIKAGTIVETVPFEIDGDKLQAVFSGDKLPTNDGKLDLYINLNSGISFNNSQKLEFKVTATSSDGSKSTDAIFSVVGLKYGKDGETFSLKLSANNIVFDSNKDKSDYNAYSPRTLTCKAYLNKTKLVTEDTSRTTGYTILSSDTEITETTISEISGYSRYDGTSISANTVSSNTIYFYLFYRENDGDYWEYLDDESASIIPGGKNANERIFAELSNEIEGVGTGGDYILNKETAVSTKAYLYSGTSKLNITKIDVKVDSDMTGITYSAITGTTVINSGIVTAQTTTITGLSGKDLELKFGLFDGLVFPDETYKRTIEIGLYTGNTAYTADFSILAIKEGAEGSIYRLITSLDTIVYDPNQLKYEDSEIECAAYSGGVSLSANTPDSKFIIYYTLDDICNEKPEESGCTLSALTSALTLTFADLGTFKKIYFYLYYHLDGDSYLFDRECVPVVNNGLNAVDSRVYLELGNEMSPVSVGDNSILDTEEPVPVDIDFMLFSGSSEIGFSGITVQCDEGFSGFTCELYTGATSETELTATTINAEGRATFNNVIEKGKEPRIIIYLENGFDFGVFSKKKIKISVTTTVDGEDKPFSATHTIVGVKNGKDGEEGLVYRLLPSTSSIIRTDNGNASYSPSYISCDAVTKYGTLSGETDDNDNYLFTITYAVDSAITKTYPGTTYERPTGGTDYDRWNSGLTLTDLIQNGEDHVYFGLWFNFEGTSNLIDKEGIPILTQPSDRIYLECGNEIEAVGTGGDEDEYQLDHDTHVNTNITLFSGAAQIDFTSDITLESVGCELSGCTCKITFGNNATAETTFSGADNVCKAVFNYDSGIFSGSTAKIDILLKAGTVFDSGTSKIYVTISTKYNNVTYPCTFIIYGLKNGEDGAVYRLVPQYDSVVYDQNGSEYIPSGMTCSAIGNGHDIGIVHSGGSEGFQILYSYDEIQPYSGLTDMPSSGISFDNSLAHERIYFYLYYNWQNDSNEWSHEIFDRESIPVLLNGLDGEDGTPGTPGEDSISYWLTPSTTSIVVNKDETNYTVSCEAYKQVGSNEPISSSGFTGTTGEPNIYYYFDKIKTVVSGYTGGTVLTFTKSELKEETRLTFVLKTGSTIYDTRAIDILVDKAKILRRSVWETGKTYYDGETEDADGNYYYDVVTNKGVAYAEDATLNYWVCISSHTSNIYNCPWSSTTAGGQWSGDSYWTGLTAQEPMTTPLIIASAISSDYLDVNNLYVYDNNTANKKVILYAGNQNIPLICGSNVDTGATTSTIENKAGITSWITATGEIHSKNLVANGGSIGGWEITENNLVSNNNAVVLDSYNGEISVRDAITEEPLTIINGDAYKKSDFDVSGTYNIGGGGVENVFEYSNPSTAYAFIHTFSASTDQFITSSNVTIRAHNFTINNIIFQDLRPSDWTEINVFTGRITLKLELTNKTNDTLTQEIVKKVIEFDTKQEYLDISNSPQELCINKNFVAEINSANTYCFTFSIDISIGSSQGHPDFRGVNALILYDFTRNGIIEYGTPIDSKNIFFKNGIMSSADEKNMFLLINEKLSYKAGAVTLTGNSSTLKFVTNDKYGIDISTYAKSGGVMDAGLKSYFNVKFGTLWTQLIHGNDLPERLRVGNSVLNRTGTTLFTRDLGVEIVKYKYCFIHGASKEALPDFSGMKEGEDFYIYTANMLDIYCPMNTQDSVKCLKKDGTVIEGSGSNTKFIYITSFNDGAFLHIIYLSKTDRIIIVIEE